MGPLPECELLKTSTSVSRAEIGWNVCVIEPSRAAATGNPESSESVSGVRIDPDRASRRWRRMAELLAGVLSGAFIGYLFRAREFRRDQRLRTYGEFMRGLLEVARSGAGLQTVYTQLGSLSDLRDDSQREAYHAAWSTHHPARAAFEESAARLRLIASSRVRSAAVIVEEWVAANVHGVPPFTTGYAPAATVGKSGPMPMQDESVEIARQFADSARCDIVASVLRDRRC